MKQIYKNKERNKISQFSNIIEKNKKINSHLENSKNEYKEKITYKNNENKTIYLNKLDEILDIRKIKLRKNNNKALFNSLIHKNNKIESYRSAQNIFLYILIIFSLISLTNESLLLRQLNFLCTVKITFKETGKNQFLGQNYEFKPDYVWVNENPIEYQKSVEGKYTILLNENELTIKVGWNSRREIYHFIK